METEKLYLGSSCSNYYLNESSYNDYLSTKVSNEKRIFEALSETFIVNESATEKQRVAKLTALYEAKLGDKVKSGWNKFINFIKSTFAKFMESMTSILSDEKGYLEKYKDIILKKTLKIEYSYTGDYAEGIKRINNTQLPVFNYGQHSNTLKQDGYGPIMKQLVPNLEYDDGATLAEMCKSYFLVTNSGQKDVNAQNPPNMTDMYNFCYNFNKIKSICDKDISHLENSTTAINNAIRAKLNEAVNILLQEADGENNNNNQQNNNNNNTNADPNTTSNPNLNIKNTNPTANASSYNNRDQVSDEEKNKNAEDVKNAGEKSEDIDTMVNKWITVCRNIITAKWTAAEQIAKDYMAIIRAHVRSYVGKADDKADNKNVQQGTDYNNNNNSNNNNGGNKKYNSKGKEAPKGYHYDNNDNLVKDTQ